LESKHLHLEKQSEGGLVRPGGENLPEILKQRLPVGCCMIQRQLLKSSLQAGLHLFHDLGDERLLRSEVVEQHAGAGPNGRRQRAERKIRDAVAKKIDEALFQKLISSRDVTTVTLWKFPVKRKRNMKIDKDNRGGSWWPDDQSRTDGEVRRERAGCYRNAKLV
jgi:hypothetical protein